jgi:hypothetical protein
MALLAIGYKMLKLFTPVIYLLTTTFFIFFATATKTGLISA